MIIITTKKFLCFFFLFLEYHREEETHRLKYGEKDKAVQNNISNGWYTLETTCAAEGNDLFRRRD